jgi:hypothetical protein
MARRPPLRSLPVALLAALALLLAACGAGTSSRAQLQDSVRDALDVQLEHGDTIADAVTAHCDSAGPRTVCEVGVMSGGAPLLDRYAVVVGEDGCWTARRLALGRATGRNAEVPPQAQLSGCES